MFKLGRFSANAGGSFTGMVIDDAVVDLSDAVRASQRTFPFRGAALTGSERIEDLLESWDEAFDALAAIAAAARPGMLPSQAMPSEAGQSLRCLRRCRGHRKFSAPPLISVAMSTKCGAAVTAAISTARRTSWATRPAPVLTCF